MKKILLIVVLAVQSLYAQDLGKLAKPKELLKGKGVSLNGMIAANNRYYIPYGLPNRQIAYQYMYSGRINLDIFGKINMPVSFSFANRNATFNKIAPKGVNLSQSPNRISLKPFYKGHTLYLGTNSMIFSNYSLAGHRFAGLGYEYRSKGRFPLYGSFMYGKLLNAVEMNPEIPSIKVAFKRKGYGMALGYRRNADFADVSLFNAYDIANSLGKRPDTLNIFSNSNLVASARLQKVLFRNVYLNSEFSRSGIFRNNTEHLTLGKLLNKTFSNIPTVKNAYRSSITYKIKNDEYGLEFSRVDPAYNTFGSYFFNNDLEIILARGLKSFNQNKLTIAGKIGRERGNLDKSGPKSQERYAGSLDLNYQPSPDRGILFNYSNFSNYSNLLNTYQYLKAVQSFVELDTLNYRQINQNISGSFHTKLFEVNGFKNGLTTTINLQSLKDTQGNRLVKNDMVNNTFLYTIIQEREKLSGSGGINIMKNRANGYDEFLWGPVLNASKGFSDGKYMITGSLTYSLSDSEFEEGETQKNRIFTGSLSANTSIAKKHRITLSAVYMKARNPLNPALITYNFSELTFNLNYTYNFKILDLKFRQL